MVFEVLSIKSYSDVLLKESFLKEFKGRMSKLLTLSDPFGSRIRLLVQARSAPASVLAP